jgi:hypothetical protein
LKRLMIKGVALVVPAALLMGCGGGKKTAATINGETITEDEFYDRTLNVTAPELVVPYQMRQPMKAGEYALQSLVFEKLMSQLAKEKKVYPTDAEINEYIPFAKKYAPQVTFVMPDASRTEAGWRRDARIALIRRNLAKAPLKISEDEIKKSYDSLQKQLTPPDQYHMRMIDVTSQAKANTALETLKKGVAFETVALTQSEDPMSKPKGGEIGTVPSTQIPAKLLDAIKDLKPGEYTKQAVEVSQNSQQNPPGANIPGGKHFLLAQLIEKKPGTPVSFEEAKPICLFDLINKKDPNAFARVSEDIEKYKEKAKIDIKIKGYERLLDKKPRPAAGAPPLGAAPGAPGGQ